MPTNLDDMALFVEVVRAGSFTRAGQTLRIPISTLSRRVASLEERLGLQLLNRTTRRIEPTEAGRLYFDRCRPLVDAARLAHEELDALAGQPSGRIRVSMPPDFATDWLAAHFPEFTARHPGIQFDIDLAARRVDLVSERHELAIRMGEPQGDNLISRVLGRISTRLFASPDFLRSAGPIDHPDDLRTLDCATMPDQSVWRLHRGEEAVDVSVGGRFIANSVVMLKRIAALGLGVILVPEHAAEREVADGRLVPVLPDWSGATVNINAVTETRLIPRRTQLFIDFLREKLT